MLEAIRSTILVILAFTFCMPYAHANQDLVKHVYEMEAEYELPNGLLYSICYTENHWRNTPGAAGELGVCQLKPSTVRHVFGSGIIVPRPYLTLGSEGQHVRDLQQRLLKRTFYIPTDEAAGTFGESTYVAVRIFQKESKLQVDGIVGPATWKALGVEDSLEAVLNNPKKNIELAARYLSYLRNKLGTSNYMVLACAYNGGEAARYCSMDYLAKVDKALQGIQ